jgi:hypothetical protein
MIMIFMLVLFMFPSGGPKGSTHQHVQSTQALKHSSSRSSTSSSSSRGGYVYNIVLDAGSTGSRIHIFKFKRAGKQLLLQSDGFHQLKPGLSSFADNPQAAADSLKPLMEEALKAVPKDQQVRRVDGMKQGLKALCCECLLTPDQGFPSCVKYLAPQAGGCASCRRSMPVLQPPFGSACSHSAEASPGPVLTLRWLLSLVLLVAGQHWSVPQGNSWLAVAAGQQSR